MVVLQVNIGMSTLVTLSGLVGLKLDLPVLFWFTGMHITLSVHSSLSAGREIEIYGKSPVSVFGCIILVVP